VLSTEGGEKALYSGILMTYTLVMKARCINFHIAVKLHNPNVGGSFVICLHSSGAHKNSDGSNFLSSKTIARWNMFCLWHLAG
jgi:hypothetical protein